MCDLLQIYSSDRSNFENFPLKLSGLTKMQEERFYGKNEIGAAKHTAKLCHSG